MRAIAGCAVPDGGVARRTKSVSLAKERAGSAGGLLLLDDEGTAGYFLGG